MGLLVRPSCCRIIIGPKRACVAPAGTAGRRAHKHNRVQSLRAVYRSLWTSQRGCHRVCHCIAVINRLHPRAQFSLAYLLYVFIFIVWLSTSHLHFNNMMSLRWRCTVLLPNRLCKSRACMSWVVSTLALLCSAPLRINIVYSSLLGWPCCGRLQLNTIMSSVRGASCRFS